MKKTLFTATMLAAFVGAQAQTLNAAHDYIVEDTGTFSADGSFMNFGLVNGTFKSFIGLDFNGSSLGNVSGVTTATLTMQESDFTGTSSVPVHLTVWAVTDNVTSLAAGQTVIKYNDGVLGGYTNQLGTATQLGTFTFNPGSLTNGGLSHQNDAISLTTGLSSIASLIDSSSHNVRLLVTTDEAGEVTMAGAGASSVFAPELTLQTTTAPEPASMAALALGIFGLAARKRRK